jgi:hypothetical protein
MQDIIDLQNDVATLQGDVATLQADSIFTANNGLTKAGNNVALGGTLIDETFILLDGNDLHFVPTSTNSFLIESSASNAVQINTTTGVAATFENKSTTNTIQNVLQILTTNSAGAGGNGIGTQLSFVAEKSNSTNGNTSVIKSSWVDATAGDSKFEIGVTEANVNSTALTINSDGQLKLNNYGISTFAGTPSNLIGSDLTGNIVETPFYAQPKKYVATLTQTGINDPVVTTIVDELPILGIVRTGVGIYTVSASNKFTAGKTLCLFIQGAANDAILSAERTSANSVVLTTKTILGVATDGLLTNANLKIEVYS